jgi:UDP-N-acetylmuramoylalanine--D-glutamate ligase
MPVKDMKITVVGLARSGAGAASLLAKMGAAVTVTDCKPEAELADVLSRLPLGIRHALGGHPDDVFLSADMIVASPGVPLSVRALDSARKKGVPVIGELELAYRVFADYAGRPGGVRRNEAGPGKEAGIPPFLAITGSNGKSTTTTLLDAMLRAGGRRTLLGGNIGNALTEEILKITRAGDGGPSLTFDSLPDYVVVEVSSFQLEGISTFKPAVAAILNITPDHMDRYHSLREYAAAKARISENQDCHDFLVLNADDPGTRGLGENTAAGSPDRPRVVYFSRSGIVEGVYAENGMVFCHMPFLSPAYDRTPLMSASEIRIKGVHNLENAMAASAMALLAGCPAEAVGETLRGFRGLEHRLEPVRELDGVAYVNDSKGTNVGAVIKSLESFSEPIVLIAGGRDKAGDFSALREAVAGHVKLVVLIGEAAGKIREAIGDLTLTVTAHDLREAVEVSRSNARKGDIVLLSPACASFDMFRDFEDRGRQFKRIVMEMEA